MQKGQIYVSPFHEKKECLENKITVASSNMVISDGEMVVGKNVRLWRKLGEGNDENENIMIWNNGYGVKISEK